MRLELGKIGGKTVRRPNPKLENNGVFQLCIWQIQSWKTGVFSNFAFGVISVLRFWGRILWNTHVRETLDGLM